MGNNSFPKRINKLVQRDQNESNKVKLMFDFRGKKIYEPPRFMTVAQAADQLIQIIQRRREEGEELGESSTSLTLRKC